MPDLEVRDRVLGEFAFSRGPLVEPASGCRHCGEDRRRTTLADRRTQRGDERPQRLDGVFRDRIDEGEFQPNLLDRLHESFGRRGLIAGHREPERFGQTTVERLRAVPARLARDDPPDVSLPLNAGDRVTLTPLLGARKSPTFRFLVNSASASARWPHKTRHPPIRSIRYDPVHERIC